jgi:hypothetical protein
MKLMTAAEVAALLRCESVRTVKRKPIPYVRVARIRLYDPADVRAYLESQRICPSTNAPTPRSGTPKLKSTGTGLAAALAQHPAGKLRRSTASTRPSLEPAPASHEKPL